MNSREYCTCPVLRRLSGWPALSDSRMKTRSVSVPGETRQTGMTHTHGCYWHGQRRNISQPHQNIKHHIHFLHFYKRLTLLGKHILLCRINSWPKRYLDSFVHLSLTKCLNVVAQTKQYQTKWNFTISLSQIMPKWYLADVWSWCTLLFKVCGQ